MFNFAYCPLSFVLRAPEGEMIRTPLVIFHQSYVIELFHSSGQQLCKFIGTDESFYMRRRLKLSGLVWDTNMAAVSLYWDTNVSAVTSCENALVLFFFLCIFDTVYFPLSVRVNRIDLTTKQRYFKHKRRMLSWF